MTDAPQMLFVKPAEPAAKVRIPERDMRFMAANGEFVPDNQYWRLRLLHADVVEAAPPDVSSAAAPD